MLEFVLNTIFWTLAIYGLFEIIKNIIYISKYTKFKSEGIYVIIAVKNQEEKIEGFLRSILFKILYGREEYLKNIIVADLNSSDNTKENNSTSSTRCNCHDFQTFCIDLSFLFKRHLCSVKPRLF